MIARLRARLRPAPGRRLAHRWRRLTNPLWLGALRTPTPVSDQWGFDRGTPVDRHYIEHFLAQNREAVRGHVLEVQDRVYTQAFGSNVVVSDVVDVDGNNPRATLVADLADPGQVPSGKYDCAIVTQTLHLIPDVRSAIVNLHRMLAPGGTLLVTLPAVSRVSRGVGVSGDYWRFTAASARLLFAEVFGDRHVVIGSRGNVLSGIAFLAGIAAEELKPEQIDVDDPFFPVLITVRATKRADA